VVVSSSQSVTLGRHVPLPWPGQASAPPSRQGPRVIRIGRSPESDVVLDFPMISWDHARITERDGDTILEDLNSRNGTAINNIQNRIQQARIRPGDEVYLGSFKIPAARLLLNQHTAIGEAAFKRVEFSGNSMIIGRDPGCDQVLDYPMISWHHARLTRTPQGIFVEDMGSRNGTFVNGSRISGKVRVEPGQEIGLGSFRFQLREGNALERREYHGNVSIEAEGVTVNAPDGHRLLDPISMTVYPSELVALMGPAGAGKTTFLKALNGYSPPAQGRVLFNGADLYQYYDRFRLQMGYVPQDDIVHSQLTVREALYFSTKLRTDLSDEEIEKRIDNILDELGIHDKKNSLIGSPEKKVLSGGQRKRVNIAMELISDTPVLFLDEPTSGLSSYDAEGVVELLKRLSGEGKTIITTIHQPSTAVFKRFDDLIMICRDPGSTGALAFFGPAYPDSIQFFDSQGASESRSDKELSPEMLLDGLARAKTPEWCNRFAQSRYRKQFVEDRAGKTPSGQSGGDTAPARAFNLTQWLTLVRRNGILKVRDRMQFIILLLQAPLFAVLIALVFGKLDLNADHYPAVLGDPHLGDLGKRILGIQFLMAVAAIWFGCNNAARDIVGEWTVFQRERMVNLKLPSYVFSKFAILFALCAFQCLLLLGIVSRVCNLQGDFLQTAIILLAASLVGAALGLAISSRSNTTESAIAMLPVVLLPIIALSGGARPVYQMPDQAQYISNIFPSRWAFEWNIVNEAEADNDKIGVNPTNSEHCQAACPQPKAANCTSTTQSDTTEMAQPSKCWDAAQSIVPELVTTQLDSQCKENTVGRPLCTENKDTRRRSFGLTLGVLGGMLTIWLSAVLGFLKLRDIH
jgi:ABC-type multidrug transport system ATPase subunit/pSer/pThr/pTyr-binding forkhead associated (FHA) protein